ncbi:MAG: hypothetical protein OEZ39_04370 [Gammaproteobacteria bacterium]|nr:hypothetical protein [Gammaproteobacteria bacterium]MDH5651093.1 hypothetical protein [Gammaproteobacteria bacterium]
MNKVGCLICLLCLLVSCDTGVSYDLDFLDFSFSENFYHRRLNKHAEQIDFRVALEYPDVWVTDKREKLLVKNGWKVCQSNGGKWVKYQDATRQNSIQCVYQYTRYYKKDDDFMVVFLRYYDGLNDDNQCHEKPRNDHQYVFVIAHRPGDMKKELKKFDVSCE